MVMLTVIAIKVSAVDHRGSGIRWAKTMTRVFPYWYLIPSLYGAERGEVVSFRHRRGVHEGVPRLQIVDGMIYFSVTASRDGAVVIDIGREKGSPSVDTTDDTEQARQSK